MSIASFKKVTILGLSSDISAILNALQDLGCIHLIAINSPGTSNLINASTTLLDQIKMALRYLNESPEQGRSRLLWKNFNPDQVVKDILANQHALRDAIDRHEFLKTRIKELSQWGHFILPAEEELGGIKLWFYKINLKEIALIPSDQPIQEVYRTHRHVYIVWLSEEEPLLSPFSSARVHTGAVALNCLRDELDEINELIDDLIDQRRNLTRYRYLLSREVAQFSDRTQLNQAKDKIQDHQEFSVLQGWIPESQLKLIEQYCSVNQLGLAIEDPLKDELPPTLMESPPWLKGGQELVNFYQTPGYHALDPSLMVFFSFSIFFAMILADAGYGIVLAVFTLIGWKRIGTYNAGSWLRPLLVVISIFSIIYGVLLGSYWGIEPKSGTFLAQFKILNINNFKSMMELVLFIGCLHLCIASGLRSWYAQTHYERMESLGIIILIISVVLLSIGLIGSNNSVTKLAILMLIISVLLMMFYASSEPVISPLTFLKRVIHGLVAIAEIPSLFGDILSYLRLFALGLAGASLAITFNTMAHQATQSSHWVLGVLILLAGQTMNFLLCLMSAVIHGLRLNYIEFFKWSIKEDGYPYQPFRKEEIVHE
ncbi:V-type ATP synthase subunit I [Legionella bononiensis]|uniref:V-type ATP synthase subunit I n=1 Tax=Legionella bononiensis TaxID=2793102 RepID=A0ABS1W6N3_9GAMM|nr:V-type ATPase 116kDa subunit family protein [Legionella bononiensis]MBL7478431.1 V-type ATP synthase subunit I [Legionella bononiensis]MBL7525028.1 V-type ATP synthase subunit I [Legionella bononiensis]MBL7561325.1 V-type ATP synthase subunit I [Legionella bononiensis]